MADEQILEAFYALIEHKVQLALPETQRGLRARPAIKARVPLEVQAAIVQVVAKIVGEVGGVVDAVVPFAQAVCETCGNEGLKTGACPTCGKKGVPGLQYPQLHFHDEIDGNGNLKGKKP